MAGFKIYEGNGGITGFDSADHDDRYTFFFFVEFGGYIFGIGISEDGYFIVAVYYGGRWIILGMF